MMIIYNDIWSLGYFIDYMSSDNLFIITLNGQMIIANICFYNDILITNDMYICMMIFAKYIADINNIQPQLFYISPLSPLQFLSNLIYIMDYFEKKKCLFVFGQMLKYYNKILVVTDPIYENIQPSTSIEKSIVKYVLYDKMLDLIPHTSIGLVSNLKAIGRNMSINIIGKCWQKSNYKFVNDLDYITIMNSVNFQTDSSNVSQKDLFNDFIDNYIGYGLITQKNNRHVIDTRYLQKFEIREEYSKLNTFIYLDDNLHFDYCKINGIKRTDSLAIRECITAITTIVTIEKHALQIHFLISDKFNLLLDTLDKTNPIYRILIPITHSPYSVNEAASITLLGQTGLCNWFNFTRTGLKQYNDFVKQNFKIRDFLIPKIIQGKSSIYLHQHLWFDCIHNFVKEFLSIQINLDCDNFIELLNKNYDEIYDKTKNKSENLIDICTMMIYSNIIHESYSNSKISKLSMNPYTLSTTWKQNNSFNVSDKINNLGEQTEVNFIAYITSLEAIRMDDIRWINMCCVNDNEKKVYRDFITKISHLDIPEDAILHPKNISSSISY